MLSINISDVQNVLNLVATHLIAIAVALVIAIAAPMSYSMSDENKATFYNNSNYLTAGATAADEDPDAEYPTTEANNGVKLVDLRGLDYDDEKWDELLEELSLKEMTELIGMGGYQTVAIDTIDK